MLIGKELLEHFLAVGPYLKEVFGKDITVSIAGADARKIIGYFPCDKLDFGDDDMEDDDPMRIALLEKQTKYSRVPKELYGVAVKGLITPIFDENHNVIGGIGIAESLEQETKVIELTNNLNQALEQIAASIEQIAASAEEIRDAEQELNNNINKIAKMILEINKVLSFTKNIADKTNLLGLNAAIEAARAGQHGLGFGIVAQEIRKLSNESHKTANDIKTLTNQMDGTNEITLKSSKASLMATEEQAAATEEVSASIQELRSLSEQLMSLAEEL